MIVMANNQQSLRGVMLYDEPMTKHTSWRVGGKADKYYQPADIADLARLLASLPLDEQITWVGLGSNLLVRDGGIRGTVIATNGVLKGLELTDNHSVRAEAGVACAKVARFCARQGLVGGEFLAGIPGTMGGALAMNAGAFGGETWSIVANVETLDRHGKLNIRTPDQYKVGYRSVKGPAAEWFVAVTLHLASGDSKVSMQKIKSLLARRSESQPTNLPNAGSVFRNPDGDFAARLIEQSGLKGEKEGGACVSEKHANFIINTGSALAADIEKLIEKVQRIVADKQGIKLEREVRIVGEP